MSEKERRGKRGILALCKQSTMVLQTGFRIITKVTHTVSLMKHAKGLKEPKNFRERQKNLNVELQSE